MRVFKLYLLLLQRQWRTIALYVTVFLGVFLLIAVLNSGNGEYRNRSASCCAMKMTAR